MKSPLTTKSPLAINLVAALAAISGASILGSIAGRGTSGVFGLPSLAILALLVAVMTLPLAFRRWEVALVTLFAWFALEDLVRKFAGNDVHVYFVKDFLYGVLLIALLHGGAFGSSWRQATGTTRRALYALVLWGVVMAVPTGLSNWRIPFIGLRLDFLYVPLVVAGFLIGQDTARLDRLISWMLAIGSATCAVGIAQAIIGPSFLAPSVDTPNLRLELFRGNAEKFFRPTGTFVDPGRFSSAAIITLTLALAALVGARRLRSAALISTVIASIAVWLSGGRTGVLFAVALLAITLSATPLSGAKGVARRSIPVGGAGIAAIVVLIGIFPVAFESRYSFFRETIDPRSPKSDSIRRWQSGATDAIRGIRIGKLIGLGTGRQALGLQYLGQEVATDVRDDRSRQVESGFGAVAVEWGVVGLAIWLAWSYGWTKRQWRSVTDARGSPLAASGIVLISYMIFFLYIGFFGGLQGFQNYLANAYFWLLSGVLFGLPLAANKTSAGWNGTGDDEKGLSPVTA